MDSFHGCACFHYSSWSSWRVRAVDPVYDRVVIPDVGASKVSVRRQQGGKHRGLGASGIFTSQFLQNQLLPTHLSTVKVPLWLLMSVSTNPGLTWFTTMSGLGSLSIILCWILTKCHHVSNWKSLNPTNIKSLKVSGSSSNVSEMTLNDGLLMMEILKSDSD